MCLCMYRYTNFASVTCAGFFSVKGESYSKMLISFFKVFYFFQLISFLTIKVMKVKNEVLTFM